MNNIIKSPIISLSAYDLKEVAGKSTEVRGRHFHSLTYRKRGVVKSTVGKESFTSTAGTITFMPKNLVYDTQITEDTHLIAIHFDCLDYTYYDYPIVIDGSKGNCSHLFEMVYKTFSTYSSNNYECYSYFYKLLAEIEKILSKNEESKTIPAVTKAKIKIEQCFSDNNFNIDSLVRELEISASYLRSEFKKAYSFTPIEYLKHVRHQNALTLLASDYFTVEELAEKCGYGSASYFIQSFRKTTGYSPMKYKEKFFSRE